MSKSDFVKSPNPQIPADPQFRQLCQEVVAGMERLVIPGLAIGILHQDQEYAAGFGVTSVDHPLPVTAETLFQIGSITKTFLATAAMRLVEMGQMALDAPLRTYLPDLRLADEAVAAAVNMRHLLTHTGGWEGDYFNDFGWGEDALAQMVARVAGLPQLTLLGQIWSYNNAGFYLAGRVIEAVTGRPFEAAMKELVLDPLGLAMSFFFPEEVMTHRFVVGHQVFEKQARVARPWPIGRAAHPAGGLVSNVKELFRYSRFHLGDGTAPDGARLLTPESLAAMQTPLFPATGPGLIGLSWFIQNVNGHKIVGHGGGTKGQITSFRFVPDYHFAVIVLTNSDTGGTLNYEITNLALKQYLGLTVPVPTPLELPAGQLAEYTGRYEAPLDFCDLALQDGGLILQVTPRGGFPTPETPPGPTPPPVRLALYGEDRAVILDEPMKESFGEFLRDPDGRIIWFRVGGRVHRRVIE
ncbi:MAG: beta-lactamase family protein [Chloroflexi bacterium]|nr:beta-lactamase family protein [Chloroflexota bacterium]